MYMSYVLDFKEKQMEGTHMLLLPGKSSLDMYRYVNVYTCAYSALIRHSASIFVKYLSMATNLT